MPAMALLVGVSAAVAVGGAVTGTLLPQAGATINLFDTHAAASVPQLAQMMFNGAWILAGVTTTLVYFHFGARTTRDGSARRFGFIEFLAFIGSIFLAITLGVLFAGVYSAALTALIDRFHFFGTLFGLH
jgi:heme/copper-type cytochrome/quinol oxidase subunit 2